MIELLTTEKVPEWAICYLWNGDLGDVTEEEMSELSKWLDAMEAYAKAQHPDMTFAGLSYEFSDGDEAEPYFSAYPAFGERNHNALTRYGEAPFLACDVYDVDIYAVFN